MGGLLGAHYFLGNRLLGSSGLPPMWADGVVQEASVTFMCRLCGDTWGRVINTYANQYTFQMRSCEKHGDGSFIAAWANKFTELPPEVLAYELHIRLKREPPCSEPSSSSSSAISS